MEELIKKYNIDKTFFRRYFRYGAEMLYSCALQDFLLFKRGKFLNPQKKNQYIDEICKNEITDFYENNKMRLVKVDFDITTKCTLKCKYCSNLMPLFRKNNKHTEMTFEDFKSDIDALLNTVSEINVIQIIGGEPLLHKDLAKMVDYAASKDKIKTIKIITNGTMIPNENLLQTIARYNDKVYFYISNYSKNEKLAHLLKTEALQNVLKENNIKFQTMQDLQWDIECPIADYHYDETQLKQMFKSCVMATCLSIINHKLHICAKSASGFELGLFEANDFVNLLNNPNLKQDLINFYSKEYFDVCKYCKRTNTKVLPAEQED